MVFHRHVLWLKERLIVAATLSDFKVMFIDYLTYNYTYFIYALILSVAISYLASLLLTILIGIKTSPLPQQVGLKTKHADTTRH